MLPDSKKKRPKIKVPFSSFELWLEIVSWAGLVFMVLVLIEFWPSLPDTIPSHFNAWGRPDGYSGKGSLIFLPAAGLLLYLMLATLRFFPHIYNFPWPITEQNAEVQYRLAIDLLAWLKAEIVWLFAYINWGSVQVALTHSKGLGAGFLIIVLVGIFGTLGIYLFLANKAR